VEDACGKESAKKLSPEAAQLIEQAAEGVSRTGIASGACKSPDLTRRGSPGSASGLRRGGLRSRVDDDGESYLWSIVTLDRLVSL
jgi:hypothetical protein